MSTLYCDDNQRNEPKNQIGKIMQAFKKILLKIITDCLLMTIITNPSIISKAFNMLLTSPMSKVLTNPFLQTIFEDSSKTYFTDKVSYQSRNGSSDNFYDYLAGRAFPKKYFLELSEQRKKQVGDRVREQFHFAYDSYMRYAHPLDELNPIACNGRGPDINNIDNININDVLGGYHLTLVDSLDSLKIMRNETEFQKAIKIVTENLHFTLDTTVHVFESTIRIIGGLLSAYQLNNYKPKKLLNLAAELADKILPAFYESDSSLPYPRINLIDGTVNKTRTGIPPGAIGGMLLEFTTLSRLTGDPKYETAIRTAIEKLYKYRTTRGLFGSEIDVETLLWTNSMSGIGAGIDSIYECLLKNYIAYGEEADLAIYKSLLLAVNKHIRPTPGIAPCFPYKNVYAETGVQQNYWVDSLSAFYPGMLVLEGSDLQHAICLHAHYWVIFNAYSAFPERFNYKLKDAELNWYPLRPELAESTYLLYRATGHPFYQHVGEFILESLITRCKTTCGFATIHNVNEINDLEDRQESFFLSETLKYLFLLFDEENDLHSRSDYVFTTEAHILNVNNSKFNSEFGSENYKAWTFGNFNGKFSKSMIQTMNLSSTYRCANYNKDFSSLNQNDFLNFLNLEVLPDRVITFND